MIASCHQGYHSKESIAMFGKRSEKSITIWYEKKKKNRKSEIKKTQ